MRLRFFSAAWVMAVLYFGVAISLAAQDLTAQDAGVQNPQAVAAKRSIMEKDLFDFIWIAYPQVSPDGSHTAYTRVVTDNKRTGYETSIWMVANSGVDGPIRLTNGKHDTHPVWSPDGKFLAFVRGGDKDDSGKPKPSQIAILSLGGGEARLITDLPKGVAGPVWSPDSKRIAFYSSTTAEDIEKEKRKKKEAKSGANRDGNDKDGSTAGAAAGSDAVASGDSDSDHESDIHIITRAVYRSNDEGYIDFKRREHIWVIEVPRGSDESSKLHPQQLTSGDYDEGEITWSGDGSRIYFLTQRVDEPYYVLPSTDIYSVASPLSSSSVSNSASTSGTPEKLATVPMGIGDLALSPDGRHFAFHGQVSQPVRSYTQTDLWVMDVAPNAEPRNLTASYDFDMGSAVFGDNAAPRGGNGATLHWSPDGRWLFDIVERQGRTPLVKVDVQTGTVTEITQGEQAVLDFSITPDTRAAVVLVSTPTMIGDLFTVAMEGSNSGLQTRITDANKALWSQLNLTQPEEINYKSFDGLAIQGWVQKPPDFDAKKNIH